MKKPARCAALAEVHEDGTFEELAKQQYFDFEIHTAK
jgi:hypothetical protein